jgi:hypothetical protein
LGPFVRWPIDPVRHCDNCWLSNGGTRNITRVSVDIQGVEAVFCNLRAYAAGLRLYRVFLRQSVDPGSLWCRVSAIQGVFEGDCCNLGACVVAFELYRVFLRQIVVTWELVLQGLSYTRCF